MAERRPVFAGVHHRNAAGGQGRDGGEERDREVGEDDVRCGDRQQQQAGDDDDQCAEIHHGQTARVPEQTVGDADAANALGGFIAFVSAQYIGRIPHDRPFEASSLAEDSSKSLAMGPQAPQLILLYGHTACHRAAHGTRTVIARLYAIVCRSLTLIDSAERCRRRATKRHFSNTCTSDDGVCG